jgi:hypothetical protein
MPGQVFASTSEALPSYLYHTLHSTHCWFPTPPSKPHLGCINLLLHRHQWLDSPVWTLDFFRSFSQSAPMHRNIPLSLRSLAPDILDHTVLPSPSGPSNWSYLFLHVHLSCTAPNMQLRNLQTDLLIFHLPWIALRSHRYIQMLVSQVSCTSAV